MIGTTYGFSKKPVFITTFTASKKAGGRHFDMTKHLIEKMGGVVVGTKVFNDCWDNLIPSNDTFVENFCFEVNDFVRGYNGHDGSDAVDVWVIGANEKGATWLADKSGVEKTKAEAQALVKAADDLSRTAWDNDNVDGESADDKVARIGSKPSFRTIP